MADPLTCVDRNATEEIDHVVDGIGAVFVPAKDPKVVGALKREKKLLC